MVLTGASKLVFHPSPINHGFNAAGRVVFVSRFWRSAAD
jgi:hypothetical protein